MILYSIRRLSDGAFLHGYGYGTKNPGRQIWSQSPCYWRESLTVWKHLKRLCSDFVYEPYQIINYRGEFSNHIFNKKNWVNFDAQKLIAYEVIETSVKVLGERQIPAMNFVIPQDLEKLEVRYA